MTSKVSVASSFMWKLCERFSVQGSQFVIQIILARLLMPEYYGALALMMIVINLANVFVQNGFSVALIQNKEVDDEDFSSVFWLVLGLSIIIYSGIYISAPWLASSYNMQCLKEPFRLISLVLIPSALGSVQLAIIRKTMDFKKEFKSNIISIILSGIVGIFLAYSGYGLWALVTQTLLNSVLSCFTMWLVLKWRPRFIFNFNKVKKLLSFGYKLVLAGWLDSISNDLSAFIIGAKYDASSLGYYTRGKQFPYAIMGTVNSAVQCVMLPAIASIQESKYEAKRLMRRSLIASAFLIFPMMAVLAGISRPLVQLVLTDRWLECVPYLQIFCFNCAFWPVHTSNLQAINAMGRSDIFLKLEILKKGISFLSLYVAVVLFDSPIAIASIGVFTTFSSALLNCYPNNHLLSYGFLEQTKDLSPYFLTSCCIFGILVLIEDISTNLLLVLLIQIILACSIYLGICYLLKLEAFMVLVSKYKQYMI